MLRDEADQRHQADLRIDVHRAGAEIDRRLALHHAVHFAHHEQEEQGAEHRGRQSDQDDERIAEAFELRRQHQVDQNCR